MKIFVKAKTGAREESIEQIDNTHFVVSVKEQPVDGKANTAIIKALSKLFKIPQYNFTIKSGQSIKNKTIEIA
jgi:uncharacterized protein